MSKTRPSDTKEGPIGISPSSTEWRSVDRHPPILHAFPTRLRRLLKYIVDDHGVLYSECFTHAPSSVFVEPEEAEMTWRRRRMKRHERMRYFLVTSPLVMSSGQGMLLKDVH